MEKRLAFYLNSEVGIVNLVVGWNKKERHDGRDMVSMESKSKWQCPKCGVGLPYNSIELSSWSVMI